MKVLVAIADGTEELEAVAVIDILRRGGIEVIVASVSTNQLVKCSRGVVIQADAMIDQVENIWYDGIVCPGGMPGATNLYNCETLQRILNKHHEAGKIIAAICAAPAVVLQPLNLLPNLPKSATCHPAFADKISNGCSDERVVVSGNIVTSRGPGTAIEFGLKLVELLAGQDTYEKVVTPMITHL